MNSIPKLPEGFELDQTESTPALPAGFKLDTTPSPTTTRPATGTKLPASAKTSTFDEAVEGAKAAGEVALSLGLPLVTWPTSISAQLMTRAKGGTAEQARKVRDATMELGTYEPKTERAKNVLAALSPAIQTLTLGKSAFATSPKQVEEEVDQITKNPTLNTLLKTGAVGLQQFAEPVRHAMTELGVGPGTTTYDLATSAAEVTGFAKAGRGIKNTRQGAKNFLREVKSEKAAAKAPLIELESQQQPSTARPAAKIEPAVKKPKVGEETPRTILEEADKQFAKPEVREEVNDYYRDLDKINEAKGFEEMEAYYKQLDEAPKPPEGFKIDIDPALWNATDRVFMEKLGEGIPALPEGFVEDVVPAQAESYSGTRTPEAIERMSEGYSSGIKAPKAEKPPAIEEPTPYQEIWESGTEVTKQPGFTIKDRRTVKDILADVNTALGETGAVGKDIDLTPEQLIARKRLLGDLDVFKAQAKAAGKDLAQYMKDIGTSDQLMLSFARLTRESREEGVKPKVEKGKHIFSDVEPDYPLTTYTGSKLSAMNQGLIDGTIDSSKKYKRIIEPFGGSGSEGYVVNKKLKAQRVLNDKDPNTANMNRMIKESPKDVMNEVRPLFWELKALKDKYPQGGQEAQKLVSDLMVNTKKRLTASDATDAQRAAWSIIDASSISRPRTTQNSIGYHGTNYAWQRDPIESLKRVEKVIDLSKDMENTEVTNLDGAESLRTAGKGDLALVDPPYVTHATQKVSDIRKYPEGREHLDPDYAVNFIKTEVAAALDRGADILYHNNATKEIVQALEDIGLKTKIQMVRSVGGMRAEVVGYRDVSKIDTSAGKKATTKATTELGVEAESRAQAALKASAPKVGLRLKPTAAQRAKDILTGERGSLIFGERKPFYSKLEEVINSKMRMSMPVEQLRKTALNNGVTVDEWNDVFKGVKGTLTKKQALEELAVNGVKFEDVVLGVKGEFTPKEAARFRELANLQRELTPTEYHERTVLGRAIRERSTADAQYEQYSEPGYAPGSYRELFVTASGKSHMPSFNEWFKAQTGLSVEEAGKSRADFMKSKYDATIAADWHDGHSAYSDIKNPIVRIRLNEREVNSKRVLFIEEIQGPSPENQAKIPESLRNRIYDIGVKRAIQYAKDNGFDEIAWTTGEMQAKRYDLSKHIDQITYWKNADGSYDLRTDLKNGDSISTKHPLTISDLPEYIGKEATKLILSDRYTAPKGTYGLRSGGKLENLDLKVGGEGLKRLYDETIPGLMEKYGNAKRGEIELSSKEVLKDKEGGGLEVDIEGLPDKVKNLIDSYNSGGIREERFSKLMNDEGLSPWIDPDGNIVGVYTWSKQKVLETQKTSSVPITEKTPSSFTLYSDPFGAHAAYTAGKKLLAETVDNSSVKKYANDAGKLADEYLGVISTRLKNIHPSIKYRLRNFEYNRETKIVKREAEILPFLKKVNKMSKEDYKAFDIARKNGNAAEVNALAEKYGITEEVASVRKVLDELYADGRSVGFNIRKIEEYHPREVEDFTGLMEYLYKTEGWSAIDSAIKAKEAKLNRYLTDQEKVKVADTLLRGYSTEQISLSKPGQLKARVISEITPEIDRFYRDSDSALLRYINDVTDIIEARRFFGKTAKKYEGVDIDNSIGAYILELKSKGMLSPDQERTVTDILKARFHAVGTSGVVGLYKNLAYVDVMGSIISTVTQIGDAAFTLAKYGPVETVKGFSQAVALKSKITREDLGIKRIASEFSDKSSAAKAVDTTFKAIGLSGVDSIFKATAINTAFNTAVKMSRNPKQAKILEKRLEPIFEKETANVMEEFRNGEVTENTKLYTFNELSDIQPITLSEMTQKYLTGGNGRIFYMLKTYTIKMMDVFRNEAFQKMATPGQRAEGVKNLIKLGAYLTVMNTGADVIKDLLSGRPVVLEDHVVDNIWRIAGASRYTVEKAKREGIATTAAQQILPPFKLADAIYKDLKSAGDNKGLEVTQSIPIFGKMYYWWFGKGAEKSTKDRLRRDKMKYFRMAVKDLEETGEVSKQTLESMWANKNLSDKDLKDIYDMTQKGDEYTNKLKKMKFENVLIEFDTGNAEEKEKAREVLADKYDRLSDDRKKVLEPKIKEVLSREDMNPAKNLLYKYFINKVNKDQFSEMQE